MTPAPATGGPAGSAGASEGPSGGGPGTPQRAGRSWRDLRPRILSAAVMLPAALLGIWAGGAAWTALVLVALAIMAWEWVRLCGFASRRLPGLAVPAGVLAAMLVDLAGGGGVAGIVLLLAAGALTWWLLPPAPPAGRRPAAGAWLAFGTLYVGLAGVALIRLRADDAAGLGNVLFLFAVVWASDIGAYMSGRALGGPRLARRVSPNKTWSGAAGGLLSAVTAGTVAAYVMEAGPVGGRAVLIAALLGLLTQAGDLFESWMKRRFHVKDTSTLIPGHGGLLDRLDGVLAAAPAAALVAALAGAGAPLWR